MARRTAEQKDEAVQETGPALASPAKVARDHVHAKHPETGLGVVFLPGEALPDWVEVG